MQQGYKVCPNCGLHAALDAPMCAGCGHGYRTKFANTMNQTQAVSTPAVGATVAPSGPQAQVYGTVWGPKDWLEWRVWTVWHWIWLIVSVFALYYMLRFTAFVEATDWMLKQRVFPVPLVIALASATSAFVVGLRLRRLYIMSPYTSGQWRNAIWLASVMFGIFVLTFEAIDMRDRLNSGHKPNSNAGPAN